MMLNQSNELSSRPIYISNQAILFNAYQAIFYKLTKKVDNLSKTYPGCYAIKAEDIIFLNTQINQLMNQYPVEASSVEITHKLKKPATQTFSSIEKFKMNGISSRDITQAIGYQTEFITRLPQKLEVAKDIIQKINSQLLF